VVGKYIQAMWALWSQETFKILYLQLLYIYIYIYIYILIVRSHDRKLVQALQFILVLNISAAGVITV